MQLYKKEKESLKSSKIFDDFSSTQKKIEAGEINPDYYQLECIISEIVNMYRDRGIFKFDGEQSLVRNVGKTK